VGIESKKWEFKGGQYGVAGKRKALGKNNIAGGGEEQKGRRCFT